MRQAIGTGLIFACAMLTSGCLSSRAAVPPDGKAAASVQADGFKAAQDAQAKDIARLQQGEAQARLALAEGADGQERQDALADFKKGAGLGLGVALGSRKNEIDDATIVNNKVVVTKRQRDHLRVGLEMHQLFTHNILTEAGQEATRKELIECAGDPIKCPMIAAGPFASIQSSAENSIDSFALGAMIGVRSDPRQRTSFNIGVGVVWDTHVKTLANGYVEGQAPPTAGETSVKFREGTARRMLITVSFAF